MKKIKIKHSGFSDTCWYSKFVSQSFELITEDENNYYVQTGTKIGSIEKVDGEMIDEEINTHPVLQDLLQQQKNSMIEFSTGAVRGDDSAKENYIDAISWTTLKRVAFYLKGHEKVHGKGNWKKGIPIERYEEGLTRHLQKYFSNKYEGTNVEPEVDHLAAAYFNLQGIIHEEEKLKK